MQRPRRDGFFDCQLCRRPCVDPVVIPCNPENHIVCLKCVREPFKCSPSDGLNNCQMDSFSCMKTGANFLCRSRRRNSLEESSCCNQTSQKKNHPRIHQHNDLKTIVKCRLHTDSSEEEFAKELERDGRKCSSSTPGSSLADLSDSLQRLNGHNESLAHQITQLADCVLQLTNTVAQLNDRIHQQDLLIRELTGRKINEAEVSSFQRHDDTPPVYSALQTRLTNEPSPRSDRTSKNWTNMLTRKQQLYATVDTSMYICFQSPLYTNAHIDIELFDCNSEENVCGLGDFDEHGIYRIHSRAKVIIAFCASQKCYDDTMHIHKLVLVCDTRLCCG